MISFKEYLKLMLLEISAMNNKTKNSMMVVVALATAFSLANCSTPPTKQEIGLVAGGVAGAVIGSQFGGGTGKIVGTAVGSVAGALVGSEIGKSMDTKSTKSTAPVSTATPSS